MTTELTREEKMYVVWQKCAEANPDKFGDGTKEHPHTADKPSLADVLLAMELKSVLSGWQYMVDVCGDFYALPDGKNPQLKVRWNLRVDSLDEQSPECIDFLYQLLH